MTTDAGEKLSVLIPVPITDVMLISTNVAEGDYPIWSNSKTYAVGERCINTQTHRIYESLKAGNLNKDPASVINQTGSAPWWLDVGPTNRWAAFDSQVSTQTKETMIKYVLKPGNINSIYLGGLDAEQLIITVRDRPGGDIIYQCTDPLESSMPGDYYEYCFSRFEPQRDFIVTELPPFFNCEITIELSRLSGNCACGIIVFGDFVPLGRTQYGVKVKPKSYSVIKTDDWGNTKILKRKSARDLSGSALLNIEDSESVNQCLTSVLDTPCVWVAANVKKYSSLRVFGIGSGEICYDMPKDCSLTVNVQGVI